MLKLPEELKNQIVNYLKAIQVPAQVGADLIQICKALDGLEKIEEPNPQPEPIPQATQGSQEEVKS